MLGLCDRRETSRVVLSNHTVVRLHVWLLLRDECLLHDRLDLGHLTVRFAQSRLVRLLSIVDLRQLDHIIALHQSS